MLFKRLVHGLQKTLFPAHNACHLCGRFAQRPGIACEACMDELRTLRFAPRQAAAHESHPPLTASYAAWPHIAQARSLVHLLKYQSDIDAAAVLGEGMAAAFLSSPDRPEAIDAVIPVPLHASRLEQRGYNQAHLLAQAVCRHAELPLAENALVRLLPTHSQLSRDRAARLEAMRLAFAVSAPDAVRGKRLLLVDDVLTTGATAMSCAEALMAAGAKEIWLLTACRA